MENKDQKKKSSSFTKLGSILSIVGILVSIISLYTTYSLSDIKNKDCVINSIKNISIKEFADDEIIDELTKAEHFESNGDYVICHKQKDFFSNDRIANTAIDNYELSLNKYQNLQQKNDSLKTIIDELDFRLRKLVLETKAEQTSGAGPNYSKLLREQNIVIDELETMFNIYSIRKDGFSKKIEILNEKIALAKE